jgi:diaminopimelate decarboxylase
MLVYQEKQLKFEAQTKNFSALLENYQGPMYVYDGAEMARRAAVLRSALPVNTEIFYALKANDCREVVRQFIDLGFGMDVVSRGELEWSLQQGCPPKRIIFSGVGKTENELLYAMRLGIRQINVESVPELHRLHELTHKHQLRAHIGLRVNPNVDAKTHPYIATGLKNNKFGIEVEALPECERLLHLNPLIVFQGFSVHIGSQLTDLRACTEAYDKLVPVIRDWQNKGFQFETLDAGGGLGIFYDRSDEPSEFALAKEWGARLSESWKGLARTYMVEPGRWLVAHSGVLLTRVEYIKKTSHHTFAIVDTGMHHLLRPALYQAKHRILPVVQKSNSSEREESYQVVGPICESSDVLAAAVSLPELSAGDFLAIIDAGAYGRVMSSQYNRQTPVQEVFLPDGLT